MNEKLDNFFPKLAESDKKAKDEKINDLSIRVFGNRLYKDQTLYEYLIEFFLVFISPKTENLKEGAFKFHSFEQIKNGNLKYYSDPRIGFKRFIFFDKAKAENKFEIDRKAYSEINDYLKSYIISQIPKEDVLNVVKDLFYGFSAVLKTRSWFAQSLLPLVPEMILTESIGVKKERSNYKEFLCNKCYDYGKCDSAKGDDFDWLRCDELFRADRHSFFSRGGEFYYLHLLQCIEGDSNKDGDQTEEKISARKETLEKLLKNLFDKYPQFSQLANYIQDKWKEKITACRGDEEESTEKLIYKCNLKYISEDFRSRAPYTYEELVNILKLEIDSLKKLELISNGMMLQIFRMMHIRVAKKKALWILDFCGNNEVKKYAIDSLKKFEEEIENSFREVDPESSIKKIEESRKNSILLVRKLGKEIKFIIPISGPGMRMTLNEDLVKFLVLALVKPGKKLQFTTFVEKLYEHFGIVIGPEHFRKYLHEKNAKNGKDNSGYFEINLKVFEELLKKCGFLRELSDATSIVENPYMEAKI